MDRRTMLSSISAMPFYNLTKFIPTPPLAGITAIGDSLVFGQGSAHPETDSWPAQMAIKLNASCTKLGFPGFTSDSIAVRVGASSTEMVGSWVGQNFQVSRIEKNPFFPHNRGWGSFSNANVLKGCLGEVEGILLQQDPALNAGCPIVFRANHKINNLRKNGVFTASPVPGGYLAAICVGTNDQPDGMSVQESVDNIKSIVDLCKLRFRHVILFGLLKPSSINSKLQKLYPHFFAIDESGMGLMDRLIKYSSGINKNGISKNYLRIPSNLTVDGVHLNNDGYRIWAEFAIDVMRFRGWI